MNWVRLAAVAATAGVLTTFTDWLLAGDWLQKLFGNPEAWRKRGGVLSVVISTVLPFITCAGFAVLAWKLQLDGMRNCAKLGLAIWVIGPLPLITSNAIFIKLNRMYIALHAISWLVKLMIIAVLVGKFVS